jgi:hypothetical protein
MNRALRLKLILVDERGAVVTTDQIRLETAFLHRLDVLLSLHSFALFSAAICLMKKTFRQR